jgi:hypothetical protein
MSRRRIDPMTQRELAQALRYHIDQSQLRGEPHIGIVRTLITDNPSAFRSRHVQHNLGAFRLAWIEDRSFDRDPETGARLA